MSRHHLKRTSVCCLLAILLPATLRAESDARPDKSRLRRPPQEAFDACNNRSEGETVTITTPRGETLTATCRRFQGQLAAVPQGAPTPPEAEREGSDKP